MYTRKDYDNTPIKILCCACDLLTAPTLGEGDDAQKSREAKKEIRKCPPKEIPTFL